MITLITAVPGSGKTLSAIAMIIEGLESGRPVFTNINGLVKDKFPNQHLLSEAPDDWRDTPEGSLVIYDEAQQAHLYPSNAQRGKVEDERLTAMETHRHTGHDLVFITQAPTFVHHHIRKLVGEHIHLYRGRGIGGAMRYEWSHTCDSPNDRKEQQRATGVFWKFPKEHFGYYTSAVMHTHKFKIPYKIVAIFTVVALILSFVVYNLISNDGLAVLSEPTKTEAQAEMLASARPVVKTDIYSWSSAPVAVSVAGCIANHDSSKCQCYDDDGKTLVFEHSQCLSILNNPLPRSVKVNQSKQS